jgi:hypothetical protein
MGAANSASNSGASLQDLDARCLWHRRAEIDGHLNLANVGPATTYRRTGSVWERTDLMSSGKTFAPTFGHTRSIEILVVSESNRVTCWHLSVDLKVSRDVFKTKMNVNWHPHFHLSVNLSNSTCNFKFHIVCVSWRVIIFLHKSHYMC